MYFGIIQIESLNYISWGKALVYLTGGPFAAYLFRHTGSYLFKEKQKETEKIQETELPSQEEILSKAKLNAETIKKKKL